MDEERDVMMHAINHPIGLLAQAVLNVWFSRPINDNQKLSSEIEPIFTTLCDVAAPKYSPGRVLLAANVLALFRVDYEWTTKWLLPLFSWTHFPDQATSAWVSFLWSPRLYRPLMIAWATDFLETAYHFGELGPQQRQYAALFTFAALDPEDTFTSGELKGALAVMPEGGLEEVIRNLTRALGAAGEQRKEQWDNRISKFWRELWPKNIQVRSPNIGAELAQLLVATGGAFADALATLRDWLQPIDNPDYIVGLLAESELCVENPRETLDMLNLIIDDPSFVPAGLLPCLSSIQRMWPEASKDARFKRLEQITKRLF